MPRIVEIGSLRERVELIDAPEPDGRVGRIRHANGESSDIDFATLQRLRARAEAVRDGGASNAARARPTGTLWA